MGPWSAELDRLLVANESKAARERLTLIRLFEELRSLGYAGGYDAVRRYARRWNRERGASTASAYVPMSFAPANAQPANMLFPQDGSYFEMLSRFIDAEYVDPADLYMRGMLHMIGIEKGKPFQPDAAMRTMLDQAAKTGFK